MGGIRLRNRLFSGIFDVRGLNAAVEAEEKVAEDGGMADWLHFRSSRYRLLILGQVELYRKRNQHHKASTRTRGQTVVVSLLVSGTLASNIWLARHLLDFGD